MAAIFQQFFSSPAPVETGIRNLAKSEILQIGNHLTGILADKKINLNPPQLVVVGMQSAGKSSLLNRFIEMDILPTGKTMVTRTPLNLQLVQSDRNVAEFGDYVEGGWKVTRKIDLTLDKTYIGIIHDEIKAQTIKKAGTEQGINHQPIVLKIYAPHLPNLSLIDLPGLTSVACEDKGQPADIKEQLRQMIGSHIKSDRSIILLVMAARSDLEVDPAFELVKEYDIHCERTIGVITKVDLMPLGADISDYLQNRDISKSLQLKYGYFAVRNSGPIGSSSASASVAASISTSAAALTSALTGGGGMDADGGLNLSAKQVTDAENAYFNGHPIYSKLTQLSRLGINNLTSYMSQVLTDHIRGTLPAILSEVTHLEVGINRSLQDIGQQVPEKDTDQSSLVQMLVANFCRQFMSALEERGAILNYGRQVKDLFVDYRQAIGKLNYTFSDELIANALTNCDGNHMLSLPSIEVLEYCLKKKYIGSGSGAGSTRNDPANGTGGAGLEPTGPLSVFVQPSLKCLEGMGKLMTRLVDDLIRHTPMARFPGLVNAIRKELTTSILQPHHTYCVGQLKNLIKIEENYIWTDDPQFMVELQKMYQNLKPNKIDNSTIRLLINGYFETVKRNLMDRVPKEIMYYYVAMVETDVCEKLFGKVITAQPAGKLLEESPQIAERRKKLFEQQAQIHSIKKLLNNVCK